MNKKGVNNFWKEYIKTNEMEQSKMLDELTMFQHKDKQGIFLAFVTKTMVKSYFDDIFEYCKTHQSRTKIGKK